MASQMEVADSLSVTFNSNFPTSCSYVNVYQVFSGVPYSAGTNTITSIGNPAGTEDSLSVSCEVQTPLYVAENIQLTITSAQAVFDYPAPIITNIIQNALSNTSFDLQATTINYSPLTYNWSVVGPPGSSPQITGTGSLVQLNTNQPGNYVVKLVVNDGTNNSAQYTTNITQMANLSVTIPTSTSTSTIYSPTDAINAIAQVSGGSGLYLRYAWTVSSFGNGTTLPCSSTTPTTCTLNTTLEAFQEGNSTPLPGQYVINLMVTDSLGNTASTNFTVNYITYNATLSVGQTIIDPTTSDYTDSDVIIQGKPYGLIVKISDLNGNPITGQTFNVTGNLGSSTISQLGATPDAKGNIVIPQTGNALNFTGTLQASLKVAPTTDPNSQGKTVSKTINYVSAKGPYSIYLAKDDVATVDLNLLGSLAQNYATNILPVNAVNTTVGQSIVSDTASSLSRAHINLWLQNLKSNEDAGCQSSAIVGVMGQSFFSSLGISDKNLDFSPRSGTIFVKAQPASGDQSAENFIASEVGYAMASNLLGEKPSANNSSPGYLAGESPIWTSGPLINFDTTNSLYDAFASTVFSGAVPYVSEVWVDDANYTSMLSLNTIPSRIDLKRENPNFSRGQKFYSVSGILSFVSSVVSFNSVLTVANWLCGRASLAPLNGTPFTITSVDQNGAVLSMLNTTVSIPATSRDESTTEIPFTFELADDPRTARILMTVNGVSAYSSSVFYQTLHDAITFTPDAAFTGNATTQRNNLLNSVETLKTYVDQNNWASATAFYSNQIVPLINSSMQQVAPQIVTDIEKSDLLAIVSDSQYRIASIVASNTYGPTQFFALSSDGSSYSTGQKAKLSARELIPLKDPEQEYFLSSTLDGALQKIEKVGQGIWQAVTPSLTNGTHAWAISIYVQNKTFVAQYGGLIGENQEKILHLTEALSNETDPTTIATMQKEIAELQTQDSELQNIIMNSREQLGSSETISVFAH